MTPEEKREIRIIVVIVVLAVILGPRLLNSISPASIVVTGTSDTNTQQIAGKPVAVEADGVQKIATVATDGSPILAATEPCFGNKLETFNAAVGSTVTTLLMPSPQIQTICGIHVQRNTSNDITITILEGGGSNCSTTPTILAGDPSNPQTGGIRIQTGFVRGDAGATVYRTTGPNRGICAQTGSAPGTAIVSGTFIRQ